MNFNPLCRWLVALIVVIQPPAVFSQDKFFDSGGVQIRYVEQGSGDPVVLVHGRNNSAETWISAGVLSNLATDHRVIAFDSRGHGKSGKPHESNRYGREMGLDIVRLMDHLDIQKAHVVGYSMGAQIVSQLLTTHPGRFMSATLGGAGGRVQGTSQEEEMFERQAAEIEKWGFSPLARELAGEKLTEAEIIERSQRLRLNPNRDDVAMAALVRSFRELVVTPTQLAAVTVPTLGIAGDEDANLQDLRALKKIRPDVELVVIKGATHDGNRGALGRAEFVAAVRRFLEAHPRALPR